MGMIHFQFKKDDQPYEMDLQPTDVWSPDEVFIDGSRYLLSGDPKQLAWVREQIPQFSHHETISLTTLESRLIILGAQNLSVTEKAHALAISTLSPQARQVETLHRQLEELTARRLFLQNQLKETQKIHPEHVAKLQSAVLEAKKAEMDLYLQYMVAKENFRGAVLIKQETEQLLCGGYGQTNESGKPNEKTTRFCIGSMTKQFTGASIGLLRQEPKLITNKKSREQLGLDEGKKLSLETPIKNLLPDQYWSDKWEGITLEDLLRHTSGLPGYGSFPAEESGPLFTLDALISIVKSHELLFHPGDMNFYSNDGYVLLGAIVQNLTGKELETFMHDYIFDPLHMDHTGMIASYDERTVATGFVQEESTLKRVPSPVHLSKTYAAGGLISTVEDLEKWDQILYGTSLFTEETKKILFSCPHPRKLYDDHNPTAYITDTEGKHHPIPGRKYPEIYYGAGICIAADEHIPDSKEKGSILYHKGSFPGFSSYMVRYIPSKSCIIILSNRETSDGDIPTTEKIQDHLEKILFSF